MTSFYKMLFLLSLLSFKKNPVILIPGAFRSRLNITTNVQPKWYCPKSLKDSRLWIRLGYFITPFLNCLIDYLTVDINETTNTLENKQGINIYADDFGGVNGIRGTGPSMFGIPLPPYFNYYILALEKKGYEISKSLFGAPYDWRFGAAQPESYFQKLKKLVEDAYEKNNNQKVVLIAHSLGTQITHLFLTEKTTKEWRNKYIESANLIAPSFSGASLTFNLFWRLNSKYLSIFKLNKIKELAYSLGTLHIHFPHSLGYQNTTLFVDKDGTNYNGSSLINLIKKKNYLSEKGFKIAEKIFIYLNRFPKAPDVNVNILYNSGIPTSLGLNLSSWTEFGKGIAVPGDGLVGSAVTEWICNNWNIPGKQFRCHDMKSNNREHRHKNLLFTKNTIDIVLNWIFNSENETENNTNEKYEL